MAMIVIDTPVDRTTFLRQSRRMYFYPMRKMKKEHVLGEEEENEAHAVDDDAEVLEEGGEGLGPEIGNHEADVEFHKTETRNEKRVL